MKAFAHEICNGEHKKIIVYTGGHASAEYLYANGEDQAFGIMDRAGEFMFRIQHPMQDNGLELTYPLSHGQVKMSWLGGVVRVQLTNHENATHTYEFTCTEN